MFSNSEAVDKAKTHLLSLLETSSREIEGDDACIAACYLRIKYRDTCIREIRENLDSQIFLEEEFPFHRWDSKISIIYILCFCRKYDLNKYDDALEDEIRNLVHFALEEDPWDFIDSLSIYALTQEKCQKSLKQVIDILVTKFSSTQNKEGSWGYLDDKISNTAISTLFLLTHGGEEEKIQAERGISWLISKQEKDGSWHQVNSSKEISIADRYREECVQIIATMNILSAIKLSQNDYKNEVIEDAEKWLISKQREHGAWGIYGKDNIGITLSAISSLSDNDIPRGTIKKDKKKLSPRVLPEDAKWEDITIKFLNGVDVEITYQDKPLKRTNSLEMGFDPKKGERENLSWVFLKALAGKADNQISWGDNEANAMLRSRKKATVQILRNYFELDANPFFPSKKFKGYKTRFTLIPVQSKVSPYMSEGFDDYDIPDDIARADL